MNILLVQPPIIWAGVKRPVFPLGLAYIGTFLEKNRHSVKIIDLNICNNSLQTLKDLLKKNYFDFIGLSLRDIFFYNTPQVYQWTKVINIIKSISPRSKIVCGGSAFSLLPQEIMNYIEEIDIGVIGRGEETFLDLTQRLYSEVKGIVFRNGDSLFFTSTREEISLECLPIPKRDWPDLDLSQYDMLNLQTRRGCPLKCKYCPVRYLEGEEIRCRKIESVREELDYLTSLGTKRVFFADNIFNYPFGYSLEIIELLKRYPLEWAGYFRADLLDRDYSEKIIKAGCKLILISAESGSQSVHNYLKTGLSVSTILDIPNLFCPSFKNKTIILFSFMIGLPKERLQDMLETFILIVKILLKRCSIALNPFEVIAESEIEKELGRRFINLGHPMPYN